MQYDLAVITLNNFFILTSMRKSTKFFEYQVGSFYEDTFEHITLDEANNSTAGPFSEPIPSSSWIGTLKSIGNYLRPSVGNVLKIAEDFS